ncbi:SPOR domain-containing protein [Rhodalgimonas zhirmunskyi]|uniref:SPOR domain-containing protein n=1 Tax=Rhodalgimonas zhirmunskyi TaxID=2964767 RepID=A0AAJ1U775_9RHOB|nr:SPOR domain-containing protein [Rhodoalgimonas zhirmunskyi]MDQ2094756.1 SPOR domain-containing protein [Rhodoalgimonas zhirmunskyi]
MKITRIIAISLIMASSGIMSVQAKSLKLAEIPAEFPPASFKGKQYVDSRGCVYIRAGIDGMVNWVPRVNRDRNVLCGYQPTFAKAPTPTPDASRTASAPVIAPAETATRPAAKPKVVAKPVAKPQQVAKAAPKTVAKPKPKTVAKAAPRTVAKPLPQKVIKRQVQKAPGSVKPVAVKPAAQTPVTKPVVVAAAPKPVTRETRGTARQAYRPTEVTTCPNVSGVSRYYAGRSTDGLPVRCGPQQGSYASVTTVDRQPVTVMRGGQQVVVQRRVVREVQQVPPTSRKSAPVPMTIVAPVGTPRTVTLDQVGPNTRLVPKHVWVQQQRNRLADPVPSGYRKAWDDDRLNKKRAHVTKRGIMQSNLAWTRTVPRKLYVRDSGLVVTHLYPGLKYPYYSYDEMRAAGYNVSTKNEATVLANADKYIARANASGKVKKVQRARVSTKAKAPAAQPKVASNTRSAPKAAAKGRYVQVGMFGVEQNARKAAARLQGMGLPARMGTLVKGGKRYRLVMAGPFPSDQIGAALSKARQAGFRDAYVR